jgi:16S rRNA (cytosine1402-N4)-methyltransferase
MEATIIPDTVKHYPVLLKEIISVISPQHGGTFIDCTFGQGGHSKEILKYKKTKVIGLDRDSNSQKIAEKLYNEFPDRFLFKNIKFSELKNLKLKNENIKGVIFDLGYSLNQMKDLQKGLSFNSTGKLNMKLGFNDFSASDVINKCDEKTLNKIFKYFGDEKEAKFITKKIIKNRMFKEITTEKLVNIIENTKRKKNFKIHSSTKIFQALRIFVNKEISELIYGLINSAKILKKDGILAVISFHSLEDRIVKYFFKNLSESKTFSRYEPQIEKKKFFFEMPRKKPIVPTEEELKDNPPSRSAKLRYLIKKDDIYEIETDIMEQFQELLKIENLSSIL